MFRKSVMLVIVTCILCTLSISALAGAEKKKILWTSKSGVALRTELYNKWMDEFEALNPDIDIVYQVPTGYYDTLKLWMSTGAGADVMWMGYDFFGFVDQLLPLNDLYANNKDIQEVLPNMIKAHSWDGKLLALAFGVNTHAVYYNKDAMALAGVNIPKGWTWDDALRIGKQLTKDNNGDGVTDRWAYSFYYDTWWWHYNPNPVYTADGKQVTINNPVTVSAIQFWADLFGGKLGLNVRPQFKDNDIYTGKAVAGNRGVFAIPTFREKAAFDWDVAEMPLYEYQGKKYYSTFCSPETWTIWKGTKYPEEAKKWVEYLMRKETNSELVNIVGGVVPTQPQVAIQTFLKMETPKNARVFVDSLAYWNLGYYGNPGYPDIKTLWTSQTWKDIMSGTIPAQSGVPEMERQLNQGLNDYWNRTN